MKVLTSQLETIKTSTVEEFKSLKAYDDNNTKYFLAGFELFKKQAKEKYPDLDVEAFQPYEDDESVMPADDGNVGTTFAEPQMDDDATSFFFFLFLFFLELGSFGRMIQCLNLYKF